MSIPSDENSKAERKKPQKAKTGRPKKRGRPTKKLAAERKRRAAAKAAKLQAEKGDAKSASKAPKKSTQNPPQKTAKTSPKKTAKSAHHKSFGSIENLGYVPQTPIQVVGTKWERQDGEPIIWYLRFMDYCQMAKPSIVAVYRRCRLKESLEREFTRLNPTVPLTKATIDPEVVDPDHTIRDEVEQVKRIPLNWRTAVINFRWQERYKAWQEHQAAELNDLWKQRSADYRDDCWQVYAKARDKVLAMLEIPLMQQRMETQKDAQGNTIAVTIIEPAKWGFRDTAMLMGRALEMGDSAVGSYSKAINLLLSAGFEVRSPGQAIEQTLGGNPDDDNLFADLVVTENGSEAVPADSVGNQPNDSPTPVAVTVEPGMTPAESDEDDGEIEVID